MTNVYGLSLCQASVFVASLALSGTVTTSSSQAADASRWDGDQRSAARLIAGTALGQQDARILRAGIEIKLGPNRKTYWRFPGDGGVPPRFDFTGSENVKAITVLWPAPHLFIDDGVNLIGYKGDVILPLHIVPGNEHKAVTVSLKLEYGICEKLCIPAEAQLELVLRDGATSDEAMLAAAEARVPRQIALGDGEALSIRTIRREPGSTSSRIVVDVAAPDTSSVDLFAEGPTPDWALPLPKLISAENGLRRFAYDLTGFPLGVKPEGSQLTFTAVAGDEAIEVRARLD
jgi:DsbC/DsbD-like thiol-disulfide interchange protein